MSNTNKSYVVTVSVGGVSSTKIWNSERAMPIGHPFRWVLERSPKGIEIRAVDSRSGAHGFLASALPAADASAKKAPALGLITDSALAHQDGASVQLPEAQKGAKSHYSLKI